MRIRMAQIVVVVGDMVELGLHMPGKTCHLKSIVLMNIFARFLRSSEEKNSGKTQIFLRDILQEFRIFKGSLYYVILKWATGGKGKSAFFRRTSAHEHISVSPDTHPKKKRVTKQDKKYWRGKPWVGISYPLIREGWGKYS